MTREQLVKSVEYNSETGVFTRLYNPDRSDYWNNKYACKEAGYINSMGYVEIVIGKKRALAHRLAFLYMFGEVPKDHIIHINQVKTDNRLGNLQIKTHSNTKSMLKKCQVNNYSTGVLGVSYIPELKKYTSHIGINRKQKHLGYFDTVTEASDAYWNARKELGRI